MHPRLWWLVCVVKHGDEQILFVVAVHMAMIVQEKPCVCRLNVNLYFDTWCTIQKLYTKGREHPIFLYLRSETHGAIGVVQGIKKCCSWGQTWHTYLHAVSANHPQLQPGGWIAKGADQRDRPNAFERHETVMNDPGTTAKPDVFDLGKGPTTTPGTPCPSLLRIVCGFFHIPQFFATRVVRRDLQLIVLIREDLKV